MDKIELYTNKLKDLNKNLSGLDTSLSDTKKKLSDLYSFQAFHAQVVANLEGVLARKQHIEGELLSIPHPVKCAEQMHEALVGILSGGESSDMLRKKYQEKELIKQKIQALEESVTSMQRQKTQLANDITTCTNNLNLERAKNE